MNVGLGLMTKISNQMSTHNIDKHFHLSEHLIVCCVWDTYEFERLFVRSRKKRENKNYEINMFLNYTTTCSVNFLKMFLIQ